MLKYILAFALIIPFPMCGSCQSYAGTPFYRLISAVPSTAFAEGWAHGSIKGKRRRDRSFNVELVVVTKFR